jgi:glycosyltransferase involved in cell wall biosynthesis
LGITRLLVWLRAMLLIALRESFRPKDFAYYFSFDSTIARHLIGGRVRVYEISDLRFTSRGRGRLDRLLCWIEDSILRRFDVIVLTSETFLDELEPRVPGVGRQCIVLENRMPTDVIRPLRRPSHSPTKLPIRIGYVGYIRYTDLMVAFAREVAKRPEQYEFHVYGDGYNLAELREVIENHSNLYYHGKYRNPQDLQDVYGNLDLGYAVYDNRDYNVQLAIPNKLFEHVYFGTPLLVASDTALSRHVQNWRVGMAVDPQQPNWAARCLDEIMMAELDEMKQHCLSVAESQLEIDMSELGTALFRASKAGSYETNPTESS